MRPSQIFRSIAAHGSIFKFIRNTWVGLRTPLPVSGTHWLRREIASYGIPPNSLPDAFVLELVMNIIPRVEAASRVSRALRRPPIHSTKGMFIIFGESEAAEIARVMSGEAPAFMSGVDPDFTKRVKSLMTKHDIAEVKRPT